ncbi:putative phage protein (TIGR01671 family) [Paenibacillus sp. V4I3]|uniref:YopX family protein n=1 Tax=Paenibacillus sp. V4I3 TaxID=3042305 RepID=UPI002787C718|nr:YopX family protein [Paenibacillus sp. V4I3]MDQ0873770.1 putative phage protein (TIGR01671 family) [Paenibacillus sp. V4I3]
MREIKFRCWVVRDSEDDEEVIPYMGDMREVESYINPFEEQRKGNIILMQWTGLTDRNGVDVYEGDVVALDSNGVERYQHGVVCYDSCQAKYKSVPPITYKTNAGNGGWTGYELRHYCEVIGNIYENPELINS